MEIEQTLAGSILQKPEIIGRVSHIVDSQDFKDTLSGKVFEMAKDRFIRKEPFDLVLAAELMPEHAAQLSAMYDVIPINSESYAEKIHDAARLRRLIAGLQKIQQTSTEPDYILEDMANLHKAESRKSNKKYNIADVTSRIDAFIEENRQRGSLPGIQTGFDFLDNIHVRYVPGHIWVVTGYTSVGKSKILIEKAIRTPQAKTLVISTEMSENQIMARFYARLTGISDNLVLSGRFEDGPAERIMDARENMLSRDIKIVDDVVELMDIEAMIQQESMQNGTDIVFIDYVQNCNIRGIPKREQGVEMAGRLQQLAKRTDTTIICFSQVSNSVGRGDVEQFEAKGAGEWAAVADVGVRLKRNRDDEKALLYDMQKGRHYRTITKELRFGNNFTRIDE